MEPAIEVQKVQHEPAFEIPKLILFRNFKYLVSTSIDQTEKLWMVFGTDS